jgi:hypothetical protein
MDDNNLKTKENNNRVCSLLAFLACFAWTALWNRVVVNFGYGPVLGTVEYGMQFLTMVLLYQL